MKTEGDYNQIKTKLSKIYISLKNNINKGNINIEENPDSEENEENSDKNLSIMQLINCISIYANYLIERKNKNNEINKEEDNDEKPLYKQYEELLIKAEDDIRRHIRIEQQLKIKIEDLEFELDDYRTGKIKKKVRNLNCINDSNYNSNFNSSNRMTNQAKPISVNSNNNYLILKLKKEIESLKSQLSKQEMNKNNEKFKQIENKIIQKKLNDNLRINKNIINNNKNKKEEISSLNNNSSSSLINENSHIMQIINDVIKKIDEIIDKLNNFKTTSKSLLDTIAEQTMKVNSKTLIKFL